MREIDLGKRARKYIASLPPKHAQQVATKILTLADNPEPADSKRLHGFAYRRTDVGEHRIIYSYSTDHVSVPLVGKRNDSEVYRRLDRLDR